jgi:hypothetical protein
MYILSSGPWARWYIEDGEYFQSAHGSYLTAHPDGKIYLDGKGRH